MYQGNVVPFVPIWEKVTLTIEEASSYSGIGICKLQEMTREYSCPFVLRVGNKKMIKRKEFERFIEKTSDI